MDWNKLPNNRGRSRRIRFMFSRKGNAGIDRGQKAPLDDNALYTACLGPPTMKKVSAESLSQKKRLRSLSTLIKLISAVAEACELWTPLRATKGVSEQCPSGTFAAAGGPKHGIGLLSARTCLSWALSSLSIVLCRLTASYLLRFIWDAKNCTTCVQYCIIHAHILRTGRD